jgi:uncharacterized damage-inducible protein DinB
VSAEERIERAVQALLTRLEQLPNDALYREPGAGEWAVMSTLAHVIEMLPYWAKQCQSIAASPGSAFGRTHDDPGRLNAIAAHGQDSLSAASASLRASADEAIAILQSIPRETWSVKGEHVRRGAMSIEQVIDEFMVRHVEDHLVQVNVALGAVGYSPSQVP